VMYLDPQLQVYPFFPFHWHLSFLWSICYVIFYYVSGCRPSPFPPF
jgi:hypothetical protein